MSQLFLSGQTDGVVPTLNTHTGDINSEHGLIFVGSAPFADGFIELAPTLHITARTAEDGKTQVRLEVVV